MHTNSLTFSITVLNYYFGRINKKVVITQNSLSYENKVNLGNSKKIIRPLNDTIESEIADFVIKFPLDKLEKTYINPMVKDGTQIRFIFNINNLSKEIFIGNMYQEKLGKLVKLMVTMLPEDYIQYKKEHIYPY
ncbi:MAG: hypothetical protein B6I20_01395 [Bacteroidetes bacterium 4572_117]|nr:MAG: hypothetical protein B6I20_01395 [Bacteroidetes bacterium 4572_117]